MNKFEKIAQFAIENGGTFTSKDASRLLYHTYYCNGNKHISAMLSRHVKNGTLMRLGKGVFKLNTSAHMEKSGAPKPNQISLL